MQHCKTVTIRFREKKDDTLSLFLDFYPGYRDPRTMQVIRRKSLGIYIYKDPKTPAEKAFNKKMLDKAEAIRCRIYSQVIDERYEFFQPDLMEESFLDYFRDQCTVNNTKRLSSYKQFELFTEGMCSFKDLNLQLCNRFRSYLLGEKTLRTGGRAEITQNSASAYFNVFKLILKQAFFEERIRTNFADQLKPIPCKPTVKNHLTLEELRRLYATPCDIPIMKKAILFSCLSGLRLSDIINLRWEDVRTYADGGRYIDFICEKTKRQTIIPISDEAYQIIQPQIGKQVFEGFDRLMVQTFMKGWLKEKVGIEKHITFHCFRHTYATLQLELGTDIFTVQHLLSHRNVSTTQIYVSQAAPKMREAASRIMLTDVNDKPQKRRSKKVDSDEIGQATANLLKKMRKNKGIKP